MQHSLKSEYIASLPSARVAMRYILIASCVVSAVSLWGHWDNPLKLSIGLTLLTLSMVGLLKFPITLPLGCCYLALAGYNFGNIIVGGRECGCFPFALSPMIMFGLDAAFAIFFLKHNIVLRLSIKRVSIWALIFLLGVGVFHVHFVALKAKVNENLQDVLNSKSADIYLSGAFPRTILVTRSECSVCERKATLMRAAIPQEVSFALPPIEIDISQRVTSDLWGSNRKNIGLSQSDLELLSTMDLPYVLSITTESVNLMYSSNTMGHM